MRLCINCRTLNPDDTVMCSECGMSLMGAPTGEEALKLKGQLERKAESPARKVGDGDQPPEKPGSAILAVGLAGMGCWTCAVAFWGASFWAVSLVSVAYTPEARQALAETRGTILVGTPALALAPWLIAGVLWWKSRKSAGPKDAE